MAIRSRSGWWFRVLLLITLIVGTIIVIGLVGDRDVQEACYEKCEENYGQFGPNMKLRTCKIGCWIGIAPSTQ